MSQPRNIISALLLTGLMVYALGDFPEGKYIGGELAPKPYLRIEGDFNIGKIHLSVSCGPKRVQWDAWFDLEAVQEDTYKLKGYMTDPKYDKLLTFLNNNCGRAPGQSVDLAIFHLKEDKKSMNTILGSDIITLYKA